MPTLRAHPSSEHPITTTCDGRQSACPPSASHPGRTRQPYSHPKGSSTMRRTRRTLAAVAAAAAVAAGAASLATPALAATTGRATAGHQAAVAFRPGSGQLVVDWDPELISILGTPGAQPATVHTTLG